MPVTDNSINSAIQNQAVNDDNFENNDNRVIDDIPVMENPINDYVADRNLSGIYGLSPSELNDPNSIKVTIADSEAPLVILFGPPACGKTMTLVRMTRFLRSQGYVVAPIRSFRPTSDTNYSEICDKFNDTMNSDDAAKATDRISFMLVEVIKNGRRICQILEAPGEYYFNPQDPNANFPAYVHTIITSQNRKVWAIMVEPNWLDQNDRSNYVTRINRLKQNMRPKDSTVFIFNKIDCTNFVRSVGYINTPAAIKEVGNLYPNIFVPFKNQHPITKIWKEYNCDFVPFQTGFYTDSVNGLKYQEGPQEYCVKLWKCIMDKIRG